ncbi:hypothetical protein KM043_006375 [Ampulex compressa]|nr:hypothetical protein KM043_006375 [Ampulex compressa]
MMRILAIRATIWLIDGPKEEGVIRQGTVVASEEHDEGDGRQRMHGCTVAMTPAGNHGSKMRGCRPPLRPSLSAPEPRIGASFYLIALGATARSRTVGAAMTRRDGGETERRRERRRRRRRREVTRVRESARETDRRRLEERKRREMEESERARRSEAEEGRKESRNEPTITASYGNSVTGQ